MKTRFYVQVGSFDPPSRISGAGNEVWVFLPFVGVKSTGGKSPSFRRFTSQFEC